MSGDEDDLWDAVARFRKDHPEPAYEATASEQRTLEVLRLVEDTLMEIYDQEQQDKALIAVREEIERLLAGTR